MKELQNVIEILKSSAIGVFGGLIGFYLNKFLGAKPDESVLIMLFGGGVLFLVVAAINHGANRIIEGSAWIRKAIVRDRFVEGTWFQCIQDESLQDRPALFSLVHIKFEEGNLKVSGESFDVNGNFTANFHSSHSDYVGNTLRYPFVVHTIEEKSRKIFGIGKLVFTESPSKRDQYLGFISSNLRPHPVMVTGQRVEPSAIRGHQSTPEMRIRLIQKLCSNDQKNLPGNSTER